MTASIVPFQFENNQVRAAADARGAPWFVAKDVTEILGYDQTANGLKHCQKAVANRGFNESHNLPPATKWIPESDVYRLVMRSNMSRSEKAKQRMFDQIHSAKAILAALSDFEVPDDLPDMYVYAIREVDTGHIKLGISRDPNQRIRQLQTANSSELELVAYRRAENRFADERAIHADAEAYRLRGEWFEAGAMEVMQ